MSAAIAILPRSPAVSSAAFAVPDPSRLIDAFFAGRNAQTVRAYRQDLEGFTAFVGLDSVESAVSLLFTAGHGSANAVALAYRTDMIERGLQSATVNRRLAALRSVVKLANVLGLVSWSLAVENIKSQSYRDTRGPGRRGFKTLVETASAGQNGPKALRDVALLRLMHDMGLRRGEVVSLDVEHLDLTGDRIFVLGKGRMQRVPLTIPDRTKAALVAWLEARGAAAGPVFTNFDRAGKGSGRLTGAAVYAIVRTCGAATGMMVRPHGLRHLAITTALDLTKGDVRAVQQFSRHADMRILTVYDDNRLDLAGDVARLVAGE